MERYATALVVMSLLLAGIPSNVSGSNHSGTEEVNILISKNVWKSSETFSANITAMNLSVGQYYTLNWAIYLGNTSISSSPLRSGQSSFSANTNASAIYVEINHLNSTISHLHHLDVELVSSTVIVSHVMKNFSVFNDAIATSYSDIIFFGDSLSDMGNSYSQWGTPESPPYWSGRFSNGEVWSEHFGQFMGITMTAGRGTASGNNRAYGGAHSGNGSYLFVIPNLGKQVEDYTQNHQIGANDLVVIWAGGNDFVHSDEDDTQLVVDNIESRMQSLMSAGASEFLIFELPPLDTVPRVSEENDAAGVDEMHNRIIDFNSKLHSMLNDSVANLNTVIHRGFAWQVFDIVYNNPSFFGITNITHPACDHDGYSCSSGDTIAPNVDEYIYFDKMHPTRTMHNLVGLYAQEIMGIADLDGDDVADEFDECLDTLPGVEVTANGCDVPPPDLDGDGVLNEDDYCPNTPINESVNADGCAQSQLDDDVDLVANDVDQCPFTPAGEAVDEYGCSWSQFDDDNDGITNGDDECSNTTSGQAVDWRGCAAYQSDTDNDGVTDDIDYCPNTWAGSQVDLQGCALYQKDSDEDAVTDNKDLCSDTPLGADVDAEGCGPTQKDSDGDGVANAYDECQETPSGELVNAVGCALVELDSDHDGFSDAIDKCPQTEYSIETDEEGCSTAQLDADDDGVNDRDDLCKMIKGEIGGCPTIVVNFSTPQFASQHYLGDNVTFEFSISCSSSCLMNVSLIERLGLFSAPKQHDLTNGTYEWTFTIPADSSLKRIDWDLVISVDGVSESAPMAILLVTKPIIEDNNQTDDEMANSSDSVSANGDLLETNQIAILLLLGILVVLIALYRQRPPNQPLLSDEEKWSEQTSLVTSMNGTGVPDNV